VADGNGASLAVGDPTGVLVGSAAPGDAGNPAEQAARITPMNAELALRDCMRRILGGVTCGKTAER
jgi:hypothetical protein